MAPFNDGDKVVAELVLQGRRHADHKVRIETVLETVKMPPPVQSQSLLIHGIEGRFFSAGHLRRILPVLPRQEVHDYDFNNREDLRELTVFTIDSARSKRP